MGRFSPKLVAAIIALFFGIALYLRIVLPYDRVFTSQWIKFTAIDAYYYMPLVDNLAHNFPHHTAVNPYFIYPITGSGTLVIRFFGWLLASVIWLVSLGSPTEHTIDVVGVYFPAVLGALTVIPVYIIGRELFNRWAGVVAAGLLAIMPGEFLGRSILGFTDHHIAEVLFTTTTMMFLILAVKTARDRQLTFGHPIRGDWRQSLKPLIYSVLAGIFLGFYLLTWAGALLFVLIISVFIVLQFIFDHLRHKSTEYLGWVGAVLFIVAQLTFLPFPKEAFYRVSLFIAIFTPVVLSVISWLMATRKIKPAYFPLSVVGLGLAGLGILQIIRPAVLKVMLGSFSIFAPSGPGLTTIETQPLLFPYGDFTTTLAWANFTTGFFLSFISLLVLGYLMAKRGGAEKSVIVVWTLVILAAALGQRRFGYYLAVNVALLTGYLSVLVYYVVRFIINYLAGRSTEYMSGQFLEFAGFKELTARSVERATGRDYYQILGVPRTATDKQIKRAFRGLNLKYQAGSADVTEESFREINRAYEVLSGHHKRAAYDRAEYGMTKRGIEKVRQKRGGLPITPGHVNAAVAVIAIFFLVFYPNIKPAMVTASQARYAPSDAWYSSLYWLKENTPEPFGDPDYYYKAHEPIPPGGNFTYPESAYGVLAWWDYGYWITRIAHRIPVANPSQAAGPLTRVASFFTSQDEDSANEKLQKLNAPYIIIDYDTAAGKFWAIALWSGRESAEFLDTYYVPQEGNKLAPAQLFYPEYYRSIVTRLYNFDGKAVTATRLVVISYEDRVSLEGKSYKHVTGAQEFQSYEEAQAYLSSQKTGNYRLVSDNPFKSPVPLAPLQHYKLIYGSSSNMTLPGGGGIPEVKIFQYID